MNLYNSELTTTKLRKFILTPTIICSQSYDLITHKFTKNIVIVY